MDPYEPTPKSQAFAAVVKAFYENSEPVLRETLAGIERDLGIHGTMRYSVNMFNAWIELDLSNGPNRAIVATVTMGSNGMLIHFVDEGITFDKLTVYYDATSRLERVWNNYVCRLCTDIDPETAQDYTSHSDRMAAMAELTPWLRKVSTPS